MASDNGNNTTNKPPANANNERRLDPVNQVNSTEMGSSLAELGNNASPMAGESINGIKDKVNSISPGEVVGNVRGQIQSITTGQQNGNGENGEETLEKGLLLSLFWYILLVQGADLPCLRIEDLPDHEELRHIDNMEKEKIMEFLQEKYKSSANIRAGK